MHYTSPVACSRMDDALDVTVGAGGVGSGGTHHGSARGYTRYAHAGERGVARHKKRTASGVIHRPLFTLVSSASISRHCFSVGLPMRSYVSDSTSALMIAAATAWYDDTSLLLELAISHVTVNGTKPSKMITARLCEIDRPVERIAIGSCSASMTGAGPVNIAGDTPGIAYTCNSICIVGWTLSRWKGGYATAAMTSATVSDIRLRPIRPDGVPMSGHDAEMITLHSAVN